MTSKEIFVPSFMAEYSPEGDEWDVLWGDDRQESVDFSLQDVEHNLILWRDVTREEVSVHVNIWNMETDPDVRYSGQPWEGLLALLNEKFAGSGEVEQDNGDELTWCMTFEEPDNFAEDVPSPEDFLNQLTQAVIDYLLENHAIKWRVA